MHILHITNSYGGTEVYTHLIEALDQLGVKQTVFVPLNPNNRGRKGGQLIQFNVLGSAIIYSTKLQNYHRYLYDLKINTIRKEIEKVVDIKNVDLIHAGLFSTDGAVAFEFSKVYNIPYIVAVRNTDIDFYYRKMWWRRTYFHSILKSAKNVIFISHQYKETFLKLLSNKNVYLEDTSNVVPNGLNEYYLENRDNSPKKLHSPIKIICAGAICKRKNILETLYAIESLIIKGYKIQFTAVGKGLKFRVEDKDYVRKIEEFAADKSWVHILDSLPKEDLKELYAQNHIFVMPSLRETFGIVYLEALSQGLPIIYSKGQGFDGYYKDREIGFGVNPKDSNDIANKIEYIIENYNRISKNVSKLDLHNDFSWSNIAQKYLNIYNKALDQ